MTKTKGRTMRWIRWSFVVGAVAALGAACTPMKPPQQLVTAEYMQNCTGPGAPVQQAFTVPLGVSSLVVDVFGAAGGRGRDDSVGVMAEGGDGGLGGWTRSVVPVTPGEALQVWVGCQGVDANGFPLPGYGFNGGGPGGQQGGGGGGASDVRRGGTKLVVAGGGGGGGAANGPNDGADGGGGGGINGGPGANGVDAGNCGSTPPTGGGGGTQSIGGEPGAPGAATGGTAGTGGTGGVNGTTLGGGGGGGGWFGGGGGSSGPGGNCSASGGGGGSGFGLPGTTFAGGVQPGDGVVIIYYAL